MILHDLQMYSAMCSVALLKPQECVLINGSVLVNGVS